MRLNFSNDERSRSNPSLRSVSGPRRHVRSSNAKFNPGFDERRRLCCPSFVLAPVEAVFDERKATVARSALS
jgi:hypothetical protein